LQNKYLNRYHVILHFPLNNYYFGAGWIGNLNFCGFAVVLLCIL